MVETAQAAPAELRRKEQRLDMETCPAFLLEAQASFSAEIEKQVVHFAVAVAPTPVGMTRF